jgi:tetratricopeptide (TPR) repeat protein
MEGSILSEQLTQLSLCEKLLTNLNKTTSSRKASSNALNGIKDILLKKCQIYLSIRLYGKALSAIDSCLQEDKSDYKAQIFKIKALLGLGQYQECLNFINKCIKITESSNITATPTTATKGNLDAQMKSRHLRTLKNQLKDAKYLLDQQREGFYAMNLFVPNRKVRYDTVAEYKGPVEIDSTIPGKGRGMIATEDLKPGQLLVAARAFEIIFDECTDTGTLEMAIAQKLALDPDLAPSFYELFAGNDLGFLRKGHVVNPVVDLDRITGICTMNAFGNSRNTTGYGHDSRGLWLMPSFFNHDCIDFNCTWKCLGDFIFVRSLKHIKTGGELLISYTDSAEPYEERVKFFEAHDFLCSCKLCLIQMKEDDQVRKTRMEILQSVESQSSTLETDTTDQVQKKIPQFEKYLEQLEEIAKQSGKPEWDFSAHILLDQLCKMYLKSGNLKYKEIAQKYYEVVNAPKASDGERVCLEVGAAAQVASVFLKAQDFEGAAKWISILKSDLSLVYGNCDVFKSLYPILHKEANKHGIQC